MTSGKRVGMRNAMCVIVGVFIMTFSSNLRANTEDVKLARILRSKQVAINKPLKPHEPVLLGNKCDWGG